MKPFTAMAAVVFALVALIQLLRVILGWTILINGSQIPIWASLLICIIAGVLAVMVWRERRR